VGVGNPDSRSDSPGTIGRCCPSSTSSSRTYAEHYNRGRPHRALGRASPLAEAWVPVPVPVNTRDVRRLDLLGGLIHEYYGAAA
jgi:hypothetical protein